MSETTNEASSQPQTKWWHLKTFRSKLAAIGIVFALAWFFSPFGPVAIAVGLANNTPGGAIATGDLLAALPGYIGLLALGALFFPTGLGGFIPGLEQALSESVPLLVLGWLIYAAVLGAFIFVKPNKVVRGIFIGFVLLVVLNTAGCYPIVQSIR
jgi:hypothetical protein